MALDDDPYRDSALSGTCPRCAKPLDPDLSRPGRIVCLGGCGEWWHRERIAKFWHHVLASRVPTPAAWPWGPAPCALCHAPMTVGFREELRFDYCAAHGIWLDHGEPERFVELFVV